MGKSPDKSLRKADKAEPEAAIIPAAAAPSDTPSPQPDIVAAPAVEAAKEPAVNDLPVVEAPKLDAGDEMMSPAADSIAEPFMPLPAQEPSEATSELAEESTAAPPQPRSWRFALLAATIALAAALGSFLGSLGASGVARLSAAAPTTSSSTADARDVLQAMKAQLAELSAMKANLDSATRSANGQSAKLAHIADAVDRLDKRNAAASEITGSIATVQPPTPAAEPKPPVLDGWIVEDVQNGRALVATRNGGVFEVGAGSFLPGIGRVETVKREDGKWIVVTAHGVITSMR